MSLRCGGSLLWFFMDAFTSKECEQCRDAGVPLEFLSSSASGLQDS